MRGFSHGSNKHRRNKAKVGDFHGFHLPSFALGFSGAALFFSMMVFFGGRG